MSESQLRADLFELSQLARSTGLDPSRIRAHVAGIRADAAAVADPALADLVARVIAACDALLEADLPEPEPEPQPEPEPEPEPEPWTGLTVGLTCGDDHWVWRFPEDLARLEGEWRDGYLPLHLLPDKPPMRGLLGEVEAVASLPQTSLTATLGVPTAVLHLPDREVLYRVHRDIAVVRDGEHLFTWRFPHGADRLLEEWAQGRAPLEEMPSPRAFPRPHLGETGPPTGAESARLVLAPGHATTLEVDGRTHPLTAPLDTGSHWRAQALGPALAGRDLRVFSPIGPPQADDAAGMQGEHLIRLAVHALTAEELAGATLGRVKELKLTGAAPGVIEALIAGTTARSLRKLWLHVDAPALVAHASGTTQLELHRVPVPPLPATLRELRVVGPVDAGVLAERLRGCPGLRTLILREHGLDTAAVGTLQGSWVLDADGVGTPTGWDARGLDDELQGLRPEWDVIDPILDRWTGTLLAHLATLFARHGGRAQWPTSGRASDLVAAGTEALARVHGQGPLASLAASHLEVLEQVRQGLAGDLGNDLATWMRPLSAAVVHTSALVALWEAGAPMPPRSVGDPAERARQIREIVAGER